MLFFVVTVAGCVASLLIDTTPGLLSNGWNCPCVGVVLLAVAVAGWAAVGMRAARAIGVARSRKRPVYAAVVVAAVAAVLAIADAPRRAALFAARDEFETLAATAPPEWRRAALGRRIGMFYIDEFVSNGAGGVYFRTASRAAGVGIGPEDLHSGFAYRPYRGSNPFGSSHRMVWLFGEWYWFAAVG